MLLLTLSEFKNDIKVDQPRPCESWCAFRPCKNVATKLVEVTNCGCKTGKYWLCDKCQKAMK